MKGPDTLGHATLADSLNAACYAISHAYLWGMQDLFGIGIPGKPTSGIYGELIPGMVYDFAVNAGWIPRPYEPPEEEVSIELGSYHVEEAHQQWFMGLLEKSLSELQGTLAQNDADSEDPEAGQLQTDLWNIILTRALAYRLKRLNPQAQSETSVGTKTSEPSPEHLADTMPQWAKAFKEAQVPETSAPERIVLEENFLATHKHPVYEDAYEKQELCLMANVHRQQWERWRRAEIANNSQPGKRILDLLERNAPARSPRNLPQRKREKLRL